MLTCGDRCRVLPHDVDKKKILVIMLSTIPPKYLEAKGHWSVQIQFKVIQINLIVNIQITFRITTVYEHSPLSTLSETFCKKIHHHGQPKVKADFKIHLLRWTIPAPLSSYSCLEHQAFWKVLREAKIEPPIQTEYLRSGGATILTCQRITRSIEHQEWQMQCTTNLHARRS